MKYLSGKEFNEIIRYPFTGENWFVDVVIQGAVLMLMSFFIIGIPFMAGFVVANTKRGIDGSNHYPQWQWGLYWHLGWQTMVVNLIYYLPVVLLMGATMLLMLVGVLLGALTNSEELSALFGIIGMLGMMVMYPIMFVYAIFYAAVQMSISPMIADGKSWKEALQIKQVVWPYIKKNGLNLLIAYLITYLISMVAVFGMLFFFIGLFFTMPLAITMMAYANGVVYRLSVQHNPA